MTIHDAMTTVKIKMNRSGRTRTVCFRIPFLYRFENRAMIWYGELPKVMLRPNVTT
jgi:hypothetical protein